MDEVRFDTLASLIAAGQSGRRSALRLLVGSGASLIAGAAARGPTAVTAKKKKKKKKGKKPTCIPDCSEQECSLDACGFNCGDCGGGEDCISGFCEPRCIPYCAARECGDDGCGGTCGSCASGETCLANGKCAETCGSCPQGEDCLGNGTCAGICTINFSCDAPCACNKASGASQGHCLQLLSHEEYENAQPCTQDADCSLGEGCRNYVLHGGYINICVPVCPARTS